MMDKEYMEHHSIIEIGCFRGGYNIVYAYNNNPIHTSQNFIRIGDQSIWEYLKIPEGSVPLKYLPR